MKIKSILVFGAVLLAMVFSLASCKTTDETGTFTVIVSVGVSGTPAAGTHTLQVGDQLSYSYTLDAGYEKLTVLKDGITAAAAGTITVTSGDHTLQAYSEGNGQFTLTVSVATGVIGTPVAGTFTHTQGTVVNYSYALVEGYTNLTVKLDGTTVENIGTVTMSANRSLSVTAEKKYNVQGSWTLAETYADGSSFDVTAMFSGNYDSGTVTDSEGGLGEYVVVGDVVKFIIVFPDVTYEYSGNFSDDDTMSGTCKRYQAADNVISGTWSAIRKTTATAATRRNASAVDRVRKGIVGPGENQ